MPRSGWLVASAVLSVMVALYCVNGIAMSSLPAFAQMANAVSARTGADESAMPTLKRGLRMGEGIVPGGMVLRGSRYVGEADPGQVLALSINLNLRNVSELQRYIQELYTPGSSVYHRYLSPAEFAARYGPSAEDVRQISTYLQGVGFQVTYAEAGQQVVDFSGTVAQAQQAFGVRINTYRAANGQIFYANNTPPRVPLALRPLIGRIAGLSNAIERKQPPVSATPLLAARSMHIVQPACPVPHAGYYTPAQLAAAYNFAPLYQAGFHGEGQSVALFELDGYVPADISHYQACFDQGSHTSITTHAIDGGSATAGAGGLEVELDMQIVLGMLPGLSNLVVYQAPNTDTGYNDEWMQILNDDIPVVSTSWGICEPDLSAADLTAEQQFFMQAAAQGQSIIAASGDNGAYDCGDSTLAVDDPASNPYVTGVGGTHLTLNSDNSYKAERGWSTTDVAPSGGNAGSGGGISSIWTMPDYQSGPGVISSASSNVPCQAAAGKYCREVPDVSINADPATGYVVYCTIIAASCSPSTPFVVVGGTSAGAPVWAALAALTNQYALAHGATDMGFLNPFMYSLLNNENFYSLAFHDVVEGSNLHYAAGPGYDMVTGIGSCNAYSFALAAVATSVARPVPAGSTQWYFAEGHVGNSFQEYLTLENPGVNTTAHVLVDYLLRGSPAMNRSVSIDPGRSVTIDVNSVLGVNRAALIGQDVAIAISSDRPIIAERSMYFHFAGTMPGGSDSFGVTRPGQHFAFANAETLAGYSTFIALLDPPGQPQATVTASYYSAGKLTGRSTLVVEPGRRGTIFVNANAPAGKQFLIQLDASQPIVAERSMYFHTTLPGIPGTIAGGNTLLGAIPTLDWYLPDGYTGTPAAPTLERLILANPGTNGTGTAATVNITYAFPHAAPKTISVSVAAKSQLIEDVDADVGPATLLAIKVAVTNGVPIVAERQEFLHFPALAPASTAVEVVGSSAGAQGLPDIYNFVGGYVGSSFSEYITLFNPNSSPTSVSLTYFLARGQNNLVMQQQVQVPATSVVQINANAFLNIPATSPPGQSASVSVLVQSPSSTPVVAEQSLYFNYAGDTPGASSIVGWVN